MAPVEPILLHANQIPSDALHGSNLRDLGVPWNRSSACSTESIEHSRAPRQEPDLVSWIQGISMSPSCEKQEEVGWESIGANR